MLRAWRSLLLGMAVWLAASAGASAADAGRQAVTSNDVASEVLVLLRLPPEHFRPNADYGESYGEGMGRSARRRIAEQIARQHGLTVIGDWAMPLVGLDCFVMAVPAGQSPSELAATLSHELGVASAEPMSVYHAQGGPTAPDAPLFRVQPSALEWRLADLHQVVTGRNVRVAVIDSMIEATHPDLIGQVQVAQNFVDGQPQTPEAHGTAVAGIIAARGVGTVGVAPQARLMALRACWQLATPGTGGSNTLCDSLSLAKALHFAITHDAQVINMSLSGPSDPLLSKLIDVAIQHGITVVGAFDRSLPSGGFPASQAGVVAVIDESSIPPPRGVFSAPGRDVPAAVPGGRWYLVDGSSYAAAHVSGLFALLLEKAPSSHGASALVAAWPSGAINTCATILRASGACECSCAHAVATAARR
jgi:hypothetical protein